MDRETKNGFLKSGFFRLMLTILMAPFIGCVKFSIFAYRLTFLAFLVVSAPIVYPAIALVVMAVNVIGGFVFIFVLSLALWEYAVTGREFGLSELWKSEPVLHMGISDFFEMSRMYTDLVKFVFNDAFRRGGQR